MKLAALNMPCAVREAKRATHRRVRPAHARKVRDGAEGQSGARERTNMLATLDVSKLRTWLKEFAPENMYCAEAKRSGNPPAGETNARERLRGGADAREEGISKRSKPAHPPAGAYRHVSNARCIEVEHLIERARGLEHGLRGAGGKRERQRTGG